MKRPKPGFVADWKNKVGAIHTARAGRGQAMKRKLRVVHGERAAPAAGALVRGGVAAELAWSILGLFTGDKSSTQLALA